MGLIKFLKSIFSEENPPSPNSPQLKSFNNISESEDELIDGLKLGEIIMISWMDGKSECPNFPKYFHYEFDLDPEASLKKLLKLGFLSPLSYVEALPHLKVDKLKQILRDNKLSSTGNKSSLVSRISENLNEGIIEKYISKKIIGVTESGRRILEKNKHIIWAKKNDSKDGVVSAATVHLAMKRFGFEKTPEEVAYILFEEDFQKNIREKSYGLARNNQSGMGTLALSNGKFREAIYHYMIVTQFDLSGLSNGDYLTHPKYVMATSGIYNRIASLISKENIGHDELREMYSAAWKDAAPNWEFHYLKEDEALQCFQAGLRDDENFIESMLMNSYKNQPMSLKKKIINID